MFWFCFLFSDIESLHLFLLLRGWRKCLCTARCGARMLPCAIRPRTGTVKPLQPLGDTAVEQRVPGCAGADGRKSGRGWWLLAALPTWLCSVFEMLGFVSHRCSLTSLSLSLSHENKHLWLQVLFYNPLCKALLSYYWKCKSVFVGIMKITQYSVCHIQWEAIAPENLSC